MSDLYTRLLDATIQHLAELQDRGVRHINVAPATLASLRVSAPPVLRQVPAAAPKVTGQNVPLTAAKGGSDSQIASRTPAVTTAPSPSPAAPLDRAAKERAMETLRQRAMTCVKCPNLVAARKNVVFGVGDIHSPLMFVGEAPGADEDEQGEPFVGKAGQLLTKIIQTMGFARETVYIANILKCRPDTPGQGSGNRKPTSDEMNTCKPYLLEQIGLIRPRVIVALGATAVEGLLGNTTGIMRLRGNWQDFRGVPVMPTFHPAYLLRNQALSEKRKVWEDMLAVMGKLGLPISDKQRGYFLKAA
jgi:DNA polymerase